MWRRCYITGVLLWGNKLYEPHEFKGLNKLIEFIADPRGAAHDFRYALACSKIRKKIDWEPAHDFTEGLGHTIEGYLENQEWLENVIIDEYQEYYEKVYGDD